MWHADRGSKFEAPEGPHEWLTRGSFIATLGLDTSGGPPAAAPAESGSGERAPPRSSAIRIKVYQLK